MDAAEIAQIVPALRRRLPDLPEFHAGESPETRRRLFDGIRGFLEGSSARTPIVLVIDDLHGADRSSLLLLEFLARRLDGMRALVAATYRDTAVDDMRPLRQSLPELTTAPRATRLKLSGLSEDEVLQLLAAQVGAAAAGSVAERLYARTEGNPFFVGEFVRALAAEGSLDAASEIDAPTTVKSVIDRRLARLSESCRRTLRIAAVIGREFSTALLEQVSASPSGEVAVEAVAPALAEAADALIVTTLDESAGDWRFAHALINETLYQELEPRERGELHHRIGAAMEQLPNPEERLAELAFHFDAAGNPPDAERALSYARRAGDRALVLLAYEEAARLYEMGLAALQRSGMVDEPVRGELLLSLGEAHKRAGNTEECKRAFLRAADVTRAIGSPEMLTRAALGYAPTVFYAEAPLPDETQIGLLEEAIAAWGDTDSGLHSQALARLALALFFVDAQGRKRTLYTRAVAMARRVGDPIAVGFALNVQHQVGRGPDGLRERLVVLDEMLELAEGAGDRESTMRALVWKCSDLQELGEIEGFARNVPLLAAAAEQLRQPVWQWYARMYQANLAVLRGEWEAAEHHALEAHALGRLESAYAADLHSLPNCGRLPHCEETRNGRAIPMRPFCAEHPAPAARCTGMEIEVALERTTEVRAIFEQFAANDFDLARDLNWIHATNRLAEACFFLRDRARAQSSYDRLAPYADRWVAWYTICTYGPMSHYLGLLANLLQCWSDAEGHFEAALRVSTVAGARPFFARTEYEYASMLLARGAPRDEERAAELLAAALETARALPMRDLARKIEALRSGRPDDAELAVADESAAVFRREGESWRIAYRGAEVRLKDSKGLRYIAHLLRHPGQRFPALELPAPGGGRRHGARSLGGDQTDQVGARPHPLLARRAGPPPHRGDRHRRGMRVPAAPDEIIRWLL